MITAMFIAFSSTPKKPLWRTAIRSPLIWALVLLGAALPWHWAGNSLAIAPFLLTLVGGGLCGVVFVRFTFRIKNPKLGALIHVLGALLLGLLVSQLFFGAGISFEDKHGPRLALTALIYFALIPATAWTWFGLINRITSMVNSQAKSAVPERIAPQWEVTSSGHMVRFLAVPGRMRSLAITLLFVVLILGTALTVTLIAADSVLGFRSSRSVIIALGGLFVLPGILVLTKAFSRKTVSCSVSFEADRLEVDCGASTATIAFRDLEHFLWRSSSDYARVVLQTKKSDISLFSGLARTPKTVLPELPPLHRSIVEDLVTAGLEVCQTRAKGLTLLKRKALVSGPDTCAKGT